MATSAEKMAEIKAKKQKEKEEKAETIAMKKLYENKAPFDNSKNKKTNKE
jgi:hypothetical protein